MDLCQWEDLFRWEDRQEIWAIVDLDTSHQLMEVVTTEESADTAKVELKSFLFSYNLGLKTVRAISNDPDLAVVTVKRETSQE